jgi:CCR4-NOT transcription complex subunit 7/8
LFGELLVVSGLVLDDRVKWVSFHSGYDYGYLLKLLATMELPCDEKGFFETLKLYFPTIYDIEYMTSLLDGHFGGLQKLRPTTWVVRAWARSTELDPGTRSLPCQPLFALARTSF